MREPPKDRDGCGACECGGLIENTPEEKRALEATPTVRAWLAWFREFVTGE